MKHKKDKQKQPYPPCSGAYCKRCKGSVIFWLPLASIFPVLMSKSDLYTRWCWECGNKNVEGFASMFNGFTLKARLERF